MTRQTSIDAFYTIKENGMVGKMQEKVLEIFTFHGPLTSQEMISFLPNITDSNRGSYITRISELCRLGSLAHVGEKLNPETKMMNRLYDTTGELPKKIVEDDKIKCPTCKGRGHLLQRKLF